MNYFESLAVQSFCFRDFKDNAEVADKVNAIGLSRIELCAVHADFTDESTFDTVIDTYRRAEVQIVGIGVQPFNNDLENERKFFEFAHRAGVRVISADFSVDSVPDAYRTAEKLAEQFDMRLAIHNHGGRHWLGCATMLGHVLEQTSDRIGLMLDTAWALDSGEDPVELTERFSDRIYGVHIKDFVFDQARKPKDVVVGQGNLDLPGLIKALQSIHFQGAPILEYEGDLQNPVPALTECVREIRKVAEGVG
ncbi:MAG: sugar phosphate isomerase/epimerase [Pirellulales bacterium]|nr:sugar phosphate isomerase/epimerase [Pirellulales bacterium]